MFVAGEGLPLLPTWASNRSMGPLLKPPVRVALSLKDL